MRYGVPFGLDFDMNLAADKTHADVLARGQRIAYRWRHVIYQHVDHDKMPPPGIGEEVVEVGTPFVGLPPISSAEGKEKLRNWLACGLPVIERNDARPAGAPVVGVIVAAQTSTQCSAGEQLCNGACQDVSRNPLHCGDCNSPCGEGALCEDRQCVSCGAMDISFSNNFGAIFSNTCSGSLCHAGPRPAAGLNLEPGVAYSSLVGVPSTCGIPLVDPGNPTNSYLLNKLTGTDMCKGRQMPLRDSALSSATISKLAAWICAGAADN